MRVLTLVILEWLRGGGQWPLLYPQFPLSSRHAFVRLAQGLGSAECQPHTASSPVTMIATQKIAQSNARSLATISFGFVIICLWPIYSSTLPLLPGFLVYSFDLIRFGSST